jgi:gamma-glutamylcyclotransferase (GGCT)/AIG2-like uncharacterized protein YtfP
MREKRTIYLAYGSNLNMQQMMRRCPEAKAWGAAFLRDWRLAFHGGSGHAVATIVPHKGDCVQASLWSITENDEKALDTYEGFPGLYRKEIVKVPWGKRTVSAMVYIMNVGRVGFPSRSYFQTIFEGYDDFNLDPEPLFQALWDAQQAHLNLKW